jgi:hypothetical protein
MPFARHLSQATLPLPGKTHPGQFRGAISELRPSGRLPFESARSLKFPQLSDPIRRQGNRLLLYSIQRCGVWADMGQWVVSVLGHQNW